MATKVIRNRFATILGSVGTEADDLWRAIVTCLHIGGVIDAVATSAKAHIEDADLAICGEE